MDQIVVELFLLSIGASFVQRTTGFGFGIFIMTMLPSIMPSFGEATTLSGILAMTTSLIIVIQKYKYITWRRLLPILFTFIIISIGAISEHIVRHYTDHCEHLLRLLQQAHQGKDNTACAGYGRNIEQTDGRILRNAGTTSRTLFRQF